MNVLKSRPCWDQYFMKMAQVVSERSTCLRRQVGAVIVKDKQILSTGYNGSPTGLKHCAEAGCLRQQLKIPSGERTEICRAVHAEQNALVQAAKHGVEIAGADIYTTFEPCVLCTKMIINAGIKRVIYANPYPDALAHQLAQEAGLDMVHFASQEENEQ
ncbi:deoxycytidylate deaminase [Desulfitobacterium sp. AusDCA]|uniref:deoxycytidylate deaminase n=1 Tax=Desulfitobacterium sp. AusDCA TaxID=3240383 RepID=UPI003DA73CFE